MEARELKYRILTSICSFCMGCSTSNRLIYDHSLDGEFYLYGPEAWILGFLLNANTRQWCRHGNTMSVLSKNASDIPGYERQKQATQPWISILDRLSKSRSLATELRSVAIKKLGRSNWEQGEHECTMHQHANFDIAKAQEQYERASPCTPLSLDEGFSQLCLHFLPY